MHDVLDVLNDAPSAQFAAADFVGLLRPLQPRLYSIAASPSVHPDEAHVLVITLSYLSGGRLRLGVGSTFVNERWPLGQTAPVYVQDAQKHFAMPAHPVDPDDHDRTGHGAGAVPRLCRGTRRHRGDGSELAVLRRTVADVGVYYQPELTAWEARGLLRLDLAFSRDQPQKIYVQHRMRERRARRLRVAGTGGRGLHLRRQGTDGRRRPGRAASHRPDRRGAAPPTRRPNTSRR